MNQKQAIELCNQVEPELAKLGYHVGLTGGCLFKEGERKDADLIVYPHTTYATMPLEDLINRIGERTPLKYWKPGSGFRAGYDNKAVHKFLIGTAPDAIVVDLFFLQ